MAGYQGSKMGENWSRKFVTSYEYLVAKSGNLVAKTFSHFIKGGENDCSVPGLYPEKDTLLSGIFLYGKNNIWDFSHPSPRGYTHLPCRLLLSFFSLIHSLELFSGLPRCFFILSLDQGSGKIRNRGEYTDGYMDAGNTWEYMGIQEIIIISVPIIN